MAWTDITNAELALDEGGSYQLMREIRDNIIWIKDTLGLSVNADGSINIAKAMHVTGTITHGAYTTSIIIPAGARIFFSETTTQGDLGVRSQAAFIQIPKLDGYVKEP